MFANRKKTIHFLYSQSKSQIEVYLLRHAQSLYNAKCHQYPEKEVYGRRARQQIHFDPNLIDCSVTKYGYHITQFLQLPDCYYSAGTQESHLFFVSPLKRTLETARIVLDSHRFTKTQVLVFPQITEIVSKICDLTSDVDEKKAKYPTFKFHLFQKWIQDNNLANQNGWQDPFIDEKLQQLIEQNKKSGHRYLKALQKSFPNPIQNRQRCLQRSALALQTMKNIAEEMDYSRFMVISHNRVLKNMQEYTKKQTVERYDNCEIRKLQI